MASLRVIILIIGLALIALIYLWEIIKQRRQQRKQTLSTLYPEHDYQEVRVSSEDDASNEYADVLSELNQTLAENRQKGETGARSGMGRSSAGERQQTPAVRRTPETEDMFASFQVEGPDTSAPKANAYYDVDESAIITLHVTAMPTRVFNGNDILDAVNNVGLEFGEMNIFHHYGIGDMQGDRPIFSLSDMFEPGNFDLENLDQHNTRGLSLFFCLPIRVDGQVVFELMLNTAQRLAKRLGGEIRGPGHQVLDDRQIADIRNKISHNSSV